jgi:hypothetical protein
VLYREPRRLIPLQRSRPVAFVFLTRAAISWARRALERSGLRAVPAAVKEEAPNEGCIQGVADAGWCFALAPDNRGAGLAGALSAWAWPAVRSRL